ncbi:unnamed protein product [Symbiodinium sp. CCMP2592]|nr:unnamed protein product [Symbiodinium sp. CCMP2592]
MVRSHDAHDPIEMHCCGSSFFKKAEPILILSVFNEAIMALSFVILSSLLSVPRGNKFYSAPSDLGGCSLPVTAGLCGMLAAMWDCDTPWNAHCPHVDHPMGASYNAATLRDTCPADCQHAIVAEAGPEAEPAENVSELSATDPAMEEQARRVAKILNGVVAAIQQRADEAEASGDAAKAHNLRMVADQEAYILLHGMGLMDKDIQEVKAAEMAARQAAEEVVEADFNAETDHMFSGVKIDEAMLQHYHDSIETLGVECGDEEEATELADSESDTLHKADNQSHLTKFQANQGLDTAGYMENKCSESTLNLTFFVDKLVVAHHLHAGSSFLMEAYSSRLHKMSHHLEFAAKAALALHDDENGLAHHFVAHLRHQDNARQAAAEKVALESDTLHLKTSVHKMLHEAARSDLTEKQRVRLSKLDESHHQAIHGEDKQSMCLNHAERLQRIPNDSPLNSPVVKDYVDCLCHHNEPSIVCQAKHGAAVNQVARQIAAKLADAAQELKVDMKQAAQQMLAQSLETPETGNVSHVALARDGKIAFGPCKAPVACKICVAGVCASSPFPNAKKDHFVHVRQLFGRGVVNKPPCLSGDCAACMALFPPKEPIKFKAVLGFKVGGAGKCDDPAEFLTSFLFHLTLQVCFGGAVGKAAEWMGVNCLTLLTTEYYPFIGKMVPAALSVNFVIARAKLSTHVPVHELSGAVLDHCANQKYDNEESCARLLPLTKNYAYPKWQRDAWKSMAFFKGCYMERTETAEEKCLKKFEAARGSGGLSLKIDITVFWWWENVFKETWNF